MDEKCTVTQGCGFPAGHWSNCRVADDTSSASTPAPDAVQTTADALAVWWRAQAESEIGQTVTKATEYSGTQGGLPQDLIDLGRQVAFVQRRETEFTDAQLAEIGVWVYITGKLGRWTSALRNGRPVSDDTLLDISVYVKIAQHLRQEKSWP